MRKTVNIYITLDLTANFHLQTKSNFKHSSITTKNHNGKGNTIRGNNIHDSNNRHKMIRYHQLRQTKALEA